MKTLKLLGFIIFCVSTFCSCGSLKEPIIVKHTSLDGYKYAYISTTKEITSKVSIASANQYGAYGESIEKTIIPSDVISGILINVSSV